MRNINQYLLYIYLILLTQLQIMYHIYGLNVHFLGRYCQANNAKYTVEHLGVEKNCTMALGQTYSTAKSPWNQT